MSATVRRPRPRPGRIRRGRPARPHTLPLHDSGEAGDALWFTMPLVGGETLRPEARPAASEVLFGAPAARRRVRYGA